MKAKINAQRSAFLIPRANRREKRRKEMPSVRIELTTLRYPSFQLDPQANLSSSLEILKL